MRVVMLTFCLLLVVLAFLKRDERVGAVPEGLSSTGGTVRVTVFTDPETQCEYLTVTGDGKGITPRLGTDGFPLCANQKDTSK